MPRRADAAAPRGAGRAVALLTDFGTAGHHAGVLHGVILGIAPAARVVDLSHGVPSGDVAAAAWTLLWSWRHFPPGTVHCVVVDPGVGSGRRAVAAAAGGAFFVGPDNGVLSFALEDAGEVRAVGLPAPRLPGEAGATFHGRDLFAPAAARLARGEPLASLGRPANGLVAIPRPRAARTRGGGLAGEVVAVDRWGNLVTSVTAADLRAAGLGADATVAVGRRRVRGIAGCYADAAPGGAVALVNSSGHLEVAVNGGSAGERLAAAVGARVVVTP